MSRKLFSLSLVLIAVSLIASAQTVTNPLTPAQLKARLKAAQVINVCKDSQMCYTTICGATCGTATATCVAGSALAAISDSAITKPYVVAIGPGVYNECVAVDNKTDIALVGSGIDVTLAR